MKRFLFLAFCLLSFSLFGAAPGNFRTYADLNTILASNPTLLGPHVVTESYWAGLGKGGLELVWVTADATDTNTFSHFKSQSTDWTSPNGRWIAVRNGNNYDVTTGGARGDWPTTADDATAITAMIAVLAQNGVPANIIFPVGEYGDPGGILIGKHNGVSYSTVNGIHLIGDVKTASGEPGQVRLHVTDGLAAGILMQNCADCSVENINQVGMNSFYGEAKVDENNFAGTFLDIENFKSSVNTVSTNRYAPHVGIAIDPFSNTTPSQYPGLAANYVGTNGASSSIKILNCTFTDLVAPWVVTPATDGGGVHHFLAENIKVLQNTYGPAFGTSLVDFTVRNIQFRDVFTCFSTHDFGNQTGTLPYIDGVHAKFVTYRFQDPLVAADGQINNFDVQNSQSLTPLITSTLVNTNRSVTVGNATLDRLQVKPDGGIFIGDLFWIEDWGDDYPGVSFAAERNVNNGDPDANAHFLRLVASDGRQYAVEQFLNTGGVQVLIQNSTNTGGTAGGLSFRSKKEGPRITMFGNGMDQSGTSLDFDPLNTDGILNGQFFFNGQTPTDDLVKIQLLGTNQFLLAPVTGYTGAGTKYLSDDGTYKTVAAGGTVAGSDTQVQFNDGGAFGADSDLTWNKTDNILTIGGTTTLEKRNANDFYQVSTGVNMFFGVNGNSNILLNASGISPRAGENLGTTAFRFSNVYASSGFQLSWPGFVSFNSPTNTVVDTSGYGTPEGIIAYGVGSTYRRWDGGTGTAFYRKETGGATSSGWVATAAGGSGDALVANPLSQFAATTSAQLKSVLSDENGGASGKVIFAEGTLTLASGKTLTANNTLTFAGTDATTMTFPTTTATIARTDAGQTFTGTQNFGVVNESAVNTITLALDATPTDGLVLTNSTVATVGAQKYSPALHLGGSGWKTTATAAAQSVDFRNYLVPVQGSTAPTANLIWDYSVNGGAYATQLSILSSGGGNGAGLLFSGSSGVQILDRGSGLDFLDNPITVFKPIRTGTITAAGRVTATDYSFSGSGLFLVTANGVINVANSSGTARTGWLQWAGQSRVATQYDQTTTTLGNVTGLTATVAAGRTYNFRAVLDCTLDATGGGKWAMGGTATATAINYRVTHMAASSALMISARQTALASAVNSTAALTDDVAIIEGLITVNAAGTLTAQFAQQSAVGTSSVLVGSTMTVFDVQ